MTEKSTKLNNYIQGATAIQNALKVIAKSIKKNPVVAANVQLLLKKLNYNYVKI